MSKLEKLVVTVDRYAHLVISTAAAAIAAVDPSQLPPKWAAGVIVASQIVGLGAKYLSLGESYAPAAEKVIAGVAGDLSAVVKTPTQVAPLVADPADPNAPKGA